MLRAAFSSRIGPMDRRRLLAGIHAQAHALRLDDDTRREMQQKLVGLASAKDMSLAQLSTVWHRLTALAQDAGLAKPRARKRPGRDERLPDELASVEQGRMIAHLFADLGVSESGTARMQFCRRTCGASWPQTRAQANQVIEGLKQMRDRGWRAHGSTPSVSGSTPVDQTGGAGSRPAGCSNACEEAAEDA